MFQTAAQIQKQDLYERSILKQDNLNQVISVQPYDPENLPETQYGGETIDPNAALIPYIISNNTLHGKHISPYKRRQIEQHTSQPIHADDAQLKPVEP